MPRKRKTITPEAQRKSPLKHFIVFLLCSLVIALSSFTLSGNFSHTVEAVLRIALAAVFLAAALYARSRPTMRQYWPVLYTFFAVTLALFLQWYFNDDLLLLLGVLPVDMKNVALAKLSESLLRVLPLLGLMLLARFDFASMYLAKGRLKLSLLIGGAAFLFIAGFGLLRIYSSDEIISERILPALPWLLVFALSNAFAEELLLRSVFLKKYQGFMGAHLANLLAALAYTAAQIQPDSATPGGLLRLLILFVMSLGCGFLMQKTENIWGAWLLHAGVDIAYLLI